MILYASLKTDMSYYLNWFFCRLQEGFFDVRGTKPNEIIRKELKNIEKTFFLTKEPNKFISREKDLSAMPGTYELITSVSMYDKYYDSKNQDLSKTIAQIKRASTVVKDKNAFLYGPVFLTDINDFKWHIFKFNYICKELSESVSKAYISFSNVHKNNRGIVIIPMTKEERELFLMYCKQIAKKYHLEVDVMKNPNELTEDEIDMGEENTCLKACQYCPYNFNDGLVKSKYSVHDPASPLLIGKESITSKIIDSNSQQKTSQAIEQKSLFELLV